MLTSTTPAPLFADFAPPVAPPTALRRAITAAYRRPETVCVPPLLEQARLAPADAGAAAATAATLISAMRAKHRGSGVEGLVQEYSLSSEEGIALMCLAEALLRIPDPATRDALIRDKIGDGDWSSHLGGGRSLFVNAATWGLVVTGKLASGVNGKGLAGALTRLVAQCGEPVVRHGVNLAMRMMGEQFVTGENIGEALQRARATEARGFAYSYDMLGEAATTADDAARYYADYENAIHAIGKASGGHGIYAGPGISIKLSALHPRYSRAQNARVMAELLPKVRTLAVLAKSYDIGFNIDAEEADRLELSLDLLEALALDPLLTAWNGLGFVVQAYGKRCPFVLDFIIDLAERASRRIMVRLVKGAYWDAEIKRAQIDGLVDFPVYTRKIYTDVAYVACARKLLDARDRVFPQFATHNAQTLATIHRMAGPVFAVGDYEFQCLHGMGEPLYDEVVGKGKLDRPCRIYAPVGTHETLLAYLVRRLLENGANSSFVNRISDPAVPIAELIADPVDAVQAMTVIGASHAQIALPSALFPTRRNSQGLDLSDEASLAELGVALVTSTGIAWEAGGAGEPVRNPADRDDVVGHVVWASTADLDAALGRAAGRAGWATVDERAAVLERAADLMQARMPVLLGLIVREAGKSVANAIGEVREAIDFLRYYAEMARRTLGDTDLPLGTVACISPWNFPLAIFTGQVAAALVAGNAVIAKPAEETPLIAAEAVRLLHQAGVPGDVLQILPGDGSVGAALVAAPPVAGVIFTGSTEVARAIQLQLAKRLSAGGRPLPFIAETGGQNAMIVDSSALAEQVVGDVIASAFDSAGQRCSSLRILCLQEDVADRILAMLKGAMQEITIGRPDRLAVDIGPVITDEAKANIEQHIERMRALGRRVEQVGAAGNLATGSFVRPTIIELENIADLTGEVFGPVLHVVRYRREGLDRLIDDINATGYGLSFGLHTRLDDATDHVTARVGAGNLYVNRNMIGAVVGVQPFGGRGLSGTGPKAGGPLYLGRLVQTAPTIVRDGVRPGDPVLDDFAAWLDARGLAPQAARARAMGLGSGLGWTSEMPGPVGERNSYALHPRGRILLDADTTDALYDQVAAVLATGDQGIVIGSVGAMAGLPARVAARVSHVADWEGRGPYAGALTTKTGGALIDFQAAIAALPGPIVPVQTADTMADLPYCLDWLLDEVTISVNTAAAGGNASLMA
uniref:trifunctional transcriptional regulator/proline dehydrogenase/L-glutamate gamma-semialdehyde dehydrogenase n=1 Tax=Sphingomonas sp. TaxID=28214 RepID=UPI0025F0D11A